MKALKIIGIVIGCLAVLVSLLAVAAVVTLTAAGPAYAQKYLSEKTGFKVTSTRFELKPLNGRVELSDFTIANSSDFTATDFLTVKDAAFEAQPASFLGKEYVINEISLHLAQLTIVKNAKGEMNAKLFADKLTPAQQAKREAAQGQTTTTAKPTHEQPQPNVLIKKLVLQVDTFKFVDESRTPARETSATINFRFERAKVTDMKQLQKDLTQAAISAGLAKVGPAIVGSLSSGVFDATSLFGNTATKGLNTGASKASQSLNKAASLLKGLLKE